MPLITHDKNRAFFLHIPKTGGSTILVYFSQRCEVSFLTKLAPEGFPCTPQHWHANIISDVVHANDLSTNMMIVRNPMARMMSEYRYRSRKKRKFSFGKSGFDRFVEKCFSGYKKNAYVMGNHIRPQFEFELPNTQIFKFEDGIEHCVCAISKALHLDFNEGEIGFHNKSVQSEQISYSAGTQNSIEEFYKEDFERYNY